MSSTAPVFRSGVDQAVRYAATPKTTLVSEKGHTTAQARERIPASTNAVSAARTLTYGFASSVVMWAVGDMMPLTPLAIMSSRSIVLPWI